MSLKLVAINPSSAEEPLQSQPQGGAKKLRVPVRLKSEHIAFLVTKGYLAPAERGTAGAIKKALESFLAHNLRVGAVHPKRPATKVWPKSL